MWTSLWKESVNSALVSGAGFVLALWYVRSRVVDKKSISKSFLRYFQDLFPIGMMLLSSYLIVSVDLSIGNIFMAVAAFIYIISYIAPSVDKYDNTHRATILSLGYTRQEYVLRYLFPKSKRMWFSALANFFIAQLLTLMSFKFLISYEIPQLQEVIIFVSITLMIFGVVISVIRNLVRMER